MKTGDTIKLEHLTFDGIVEEEVLIYLGDGIYVEAQPIP